MNPHLELTDTLLCYQGCTVNERNLMNSCLTQYFPIWMNQRAFFIWFITLAYIWCNKGPPEQPSKHLQWLHDAAPLVSTTAQAHGGYIPDILLSVTNVFMLMNNIFSLYLVLQCCSWGEAGGAASLVGLMKTSLRRTEMHHLGGGP